MVKISPSILSADFANLKESINRVISGSDYLHIDVMDGQFVNNISFGMPVQKAIKPYFNLPFDTHLMILNPLKYISEFVKAGSDIITFHVEANDNPIEVIKKIHSYKVKAGISLRPKTDIHVLDPYLDQVDLVLVMSVEPGFGGQAFDPSALEKIKYLSEMKKLKGYKYEIEVDGGINADTGKLCREAGVDVLVSGSYIFKANEPLKMIESLR